MEKAICAYSKCNNQFDKRNSIHKYCCANHKQASKRERRGSIKSLSITQKVEFPSDLVKELNFRVGRINAGISDASDLVMISSIMDYMKIKTKEKTA